MKPQQKQLDLPLDHIAIAVSDLNEATTRYQKALGAIVLHDELIRSQSVRVRFLQVSDHLLELLQPTSVSSPISRFLQKRGEGMHHLAFRTTNILTEMDRLKHQGFRLLQDEPIRGANEKLIFFIHPKSMDGVLVEICQPISKEI